MTAPLFGLVLAGGRSARMARDKAALRYHGEAQLAVAFKRLQPFVEQAFVSVRPDQQHDPLRAQFPQIVDGPQSVGPISGLIAAQSAHPEAAWLLLACDLPFLSDRTLQTLVEARAIDQDATAFRSAHDGLPEPLCAIFEPRTRERMAAYVSGGRLCPRKFLLGAATRLLDPIDPSALDNVNSTDEYWQAMENLDPDTRRTPRQIRVQYFALLREQAGRSDETVETQARTPGELFDELRQRHPFTLGREMLKVAVNAEFGQWDQPLVAGDNVVFIPPVAGG